MATKKPLAPLELLRDRLAARPRGTRLVLVAEPDNLVEWPRLIADRKGNEWDVVLYRGDDCVTRRAWRRACGGERPICLVLCRGPGETGPLNASSIADLTARAEGDLLDLSLVGYFHTVFPKVNPPVPALVDFRREFVEQVQDIQKAYPQFKLRWHEPDNWTRGQFLAILAIARISELSLEQLWCDDVEAVAFAAHAVWLICHPQIKADDVRLVAEVIWESSRRPRADAACRWLDVPAADLDVFREELAAYLVLRDALGGDDVHHLDTLLAAKLGCRTFDPHEVGPLADAMTAALKEDGRWKDVQRRADSALAQGRLQRAGELFATNETATEKIVAAPDSSATLLAFLLREALIGRFQRRAPWPAWASSVASHPMLANYRRGDRLDAREHAAAALMAAVNDLGRVEESLEIAVPSFASPEELLDWYVSKECHLLELRVAEAFARIETIDDSELHQAAYEFVMAPPTGLRFRVRAFLNRLDVRLAQFIERDPQKFLYGSRSAVRIIPDVLRRSQRRQTGRVWILVMDGMRYDTWDAVVRPLLLEHFEVVDGQSRPFFSLLPSKTDIARRGLLAANLGKDWKNFLQKPTKDERILAARALGLSNQDLATRMVFVTDAETTQARERLGYDPDQGCDYNVLIYPVSDDLGHHHNDTLSSLNESIRQQLLTQQRRRGIIDDLRRRVQPGDLVLLTSDHGFQELFAEEMVTVSRLEALNSGGSEEDVAYRHLRFRPKSKLSTGAHVSLDWEELSHDGKRQKTTFTLPVGGTWYQREKGRPTRFAHGGVSLAEMTIPGVLLRPIERKAARVEFAELPRELAVQEDESTVLSFELANTGNVDAKYELAVRTNMGEVLLESRGQLAAAKRAQFSCSVTGHYESDRDRNPIADKTTTAILLDLAHSDLDGRMVRPGYGGEVVRITVKPKPTKIDTDVLQAFDDL